MASNETPDELKDYYTVTVLVTDMQGTEIFKVEVRADPEIVTKALEDAFAGD